MVLLGSVIGSAHAATCPPPTGKQVIQVQGHPFSAIPSPDGCWLFVSTNRAEAGEVVVLHDAGGSFAVDHAVSLPTQALGAAMSQDGKTLVVAGGATTSVLDVDQLERRHGLALRGVLNDGRRAGAVYVAIAPDNHHVVVADEWAAHIDMFDLAGLAGTTSGLAPMARIRTTPTPVGLAITADGHWLYATTENGLPGMPAECNAERGLDRGHTQGLLLRIDLRHALADPTHAAVGAALPADCNPVRVALGPDDRHLWVTARGSGKLLMVDAKSWLQHASQARIASYIVGNSPVGVVVRPDGREVWMTLSARFAANVKGGLLGLRLPAPGHPMKQYRLQIAGFPRELAFLPDGRSLVATLYQARKVVLITVP